ncbi:hypothetical protein BXZ70DRAFT_1007645 [Cristinia sonorae]|uniref:Uncharacterized protein n=1 Tax=Cristinia sonorae TaxID=1940300 RepID=A0A8K0UQL4_9AGAR|nr:hypothetical protein BXZ70DRAFT_1007645 [Cristinia sonorae]
MFTSRFRKPSASSNQAARVPMGVDGAARPAKATLKRHLQKIRGEGASITRRILERSKIQYPETRWKTTPYILKVSSHCRKTTIKKRCRTTFTKDDNVMVVDLTVIEPEPLVVELPNAMVMVADCNNMVQDIPTPVITATTDEVSSMEPGPGNPPGLSQCRDFPFTMETVDDDTAPVHADAHVHPPGAVRHRDTQPIIDVDAESSPALEDDEDKEELEDVYMLEGNSQLMDELAAALAKLTLTKHNGPEDVLLADPPAPVLGLYCDLEMHIQFPAPALDDRNYVSPLRTYAASSELVNVFAASAGFNTTDSEGEEEATTVLD